MSAASSNRQQQTATDSSKQQPAAADSGKQPEKIIENSLVGDGQLKLAPNTWYHPAGAKSYQFYGSKTASGITKNIAVAQHHSITKNIAAAQHHSIKTSQ